MKVRCSGDSEMCRLITALENAITLSRVRGWNRREQVLLSANTRQRKACTDADAIAIIKQVFEQEKIEIEEAK